MKGPAAYLNAHNEADAGIRQPVQLAGTTPILGTPTRVLAQSAAADSCYCIGWWNCPNSASHFADEWR